MFHGKSTQENERIEECISSHMLVVLVTFGACTYYHKNLIKGRREYPMCQCSLLNVCKVTQFGMQIITIYLRGDACIL